MSLLKNLFGGKKPDTASVTGSMPGNDAKSGVVGAVSKLFDRNEKEVAKLRPIVERINSFGPELLALSDDELKERSQALREKFKAGVTARLQRQKDAASGEPFEWQELDGELSWSDDYNRARRAAEKEVLDELLPEAFALTREAGTRTNGLRHFDVQMIGGSVLHSGRIGEMRTGEGKTLVATLPVYLNALSGRGVHVITVNDYLAERDANWMRPIYEFLGLSVAFLTNDMETEQRQAAYGADVLYATNSEVGFDYLRDNMARSPQEMVQRPLNFAIVDEVDNILIDEARTPLIISAQVAKTERALRRQQMAKTCDGVARKLMPAVTDREVEMLLDTLTTKGKIDIDGLMADIVRRGAFSQATSYLVDAYLLSEKSARVDNAAHLLDVADEFAEHGLIEDAGRAQLEALALNAVRPFGLRQSWEKEVQRLTEPFARAFSVGRVYAEADSGVLANRLAHELSLNEDGIAALVAALEEHEDRAHGVAEAIAGEMARRALIEQSAIELIVAHLLEVQAPEIGADAPRKNEAPEAIEARRLEKMASSLFNAAHPVLTELVLQVPGNLQEADAILLEAVPEAESLSSPTAVRVVIDAVEQVALRGLLPFDSTEKLWEAVRLTQGRDALRREISKAILEHPGDAARTISGLVEAYSVERDEFLKREAGTLRGQLSGHEAVAERAGKGENTEGLRRLLQNELTKSGPFAEAMKAAKAFANDQNKAHTNLAEHLAEEMAIYVEVPREARRILAGLFAEGGTGEEVRERIMLAVRDLPGENTELPALVSDSIKQLQAWRDENADALLEKIGAHIDLPQESAGAIKTAIEDGEFSAGFDHFIGEQLLTTPHIAPLTEAIEAFGARWDDFKGDQSARLLQSIAETLDVSPDAADAMRELLGKPLQGTLDAALFAELAADAVSRHLEPLLTEENAGAFAEEVKRRIPLAKDVQNKLRASDFAGRSGEQLERALTRLVERSFQSMPFEDFKRVVRNLGWLTEKDEKRRTAALTDMGTLVAEREAGTPAFTDPEGFLDTLIGAEILTDEEGAVIRRAQAETPEESLSGVIDRVLRLPAERRRRLAESKLQEVQPILDQSIKAHALFQREVNYVIDFNPQEGRREIVIVDEFTGRKMPGRRFNDGLHEALEAKHGLEVQLESQTVATITIQNYFRLYNKLAGMTGTAKTEEAEFAKTYGMEVVSIPTNRNIQRKDHPDVVYKTAESKFRAITFEVLEHHCAGQPVLVGTRSVEVSESMAERLKPQALQTLALAHLVKTKLWDDKTIAEEQKAQMLVFLRLPINYINREHREQHARQAKEMGLPANALLNLLQVKNIAKQVGIAPDILHEDNINKLLSLFTIPNTDRERLMTALRVGLPHNVLNAKNHRNEARIIAEAARAASVTIATNMAGRGVDIVLGGTLDVESRWRVMTMQILARHLEGKAVHVRARNQEATDKMTERLAPERLQDLAWLTGMVRRIDELETSRGIEGQVAKELRDVLAQELTTADLKNKVRSRARRLGLLEQLPLDEDPLQDASPIQALNARLQQLMGRTCEESALRTALENGIAAQATGRDFAEDIVLHALALPLGLAHNALGKLLDTLLELGDLDRALLEAAAQSNAARAADFDAARLAEQVGNVTVEWIASRLKALNVQDAGGTQAQLAALAASEIEINEAQLAAALAEDNLGVQWLRERLRGWKLVKNERAFQATPEMQEVLGDTAVVHYRLDRAAVQRVQSEWNADAAQRRDLVLVEVPNVILLSDMAGLIGQNAPFLNPEWLHHQLDGMGIIEQDDVFQAQMTGQAEDEQGNVHEVPIDVLVYRIRLNRVLRALDPTLREAVAKVGSDVGAVCQELGESAAWSTQFIDEAWVAERLREINPQSAVPNPQSASVYIETGVAGQSADIVLESEARPEDIAHTSEQEEVKTLGGLHILGTERHESRRIDNQLRGRAGRQGDPGSSRFFVSLEDELWRLFGVRGQWLLNKWDEDEPVEASMISKSIERAQKKVELNHFESRKHVLQYDDVMNVQREVIYRERRRALMGGDLRDTVLDMTQQAALAEADKHCPRDLRIEEWDTHKLFLGLGRLLGATMLVKHLPSDELEELRTREEIDERLREVVATCYDERETQLGTETMRSLERWQVTRSIDDHWMEHLAEMDYLRDAIWQEGYAQKEPIGVYRQEGFALFQKMLGEIRREVTEAIFSVQVDAQQSQPELYEGPQISSMQEARFLQTLPMDIDGQGDDGVQLDKDADDDDDDGPVVLSRPGPSPVERPLPPQRAANVATVERSAPQQSATNGNSNGNGSSANGSSTNGPARNMAGGPTTNGSPARANGPRVGRNDPCPCGSGKKYKKCHLPKDQGTSV